MNETMLSAWEKTVRAAPEAVALIDAATGIRRTRSELESDAAAWQAQYGHELTGRTVVMAAANGPEWWRVFLGLLKASAVIVPLDPGEPLAAQINTATAIRARWLWSGGELRAIDPKAAMPRDGRRLVKLTSGSTGTPRALAFTDAQMLADGRQVCAGMDVRPDDMNFGLIPFGHSYGLGNLVVPLLVQGTAIVCGSAALPQVMAETIAQWRPTIFPAVPALLRALVLSDVASARLASLRTVISAGAPLDPEVAEAFYRKFDRKVHSFYGSSETGGITYDQTGDAARTGRSVGTPLPGVELLFGRGHRFEVASAAVVTIGNRRRHADRAVGSHQPADLGSLTSGGELVLIGRAGRFVKIAGRRLNLAEVERALRAVPGVQDAFVAPHASRADTLSAVVATTLASDAVRAALREQLAGWKIPKQILTVVAFPITARGKTDTAQLQRMIGGP